jgi:hypothetical protein
MCRVAHNTRRKSAMSMSITKSRIFATRARRFGRPSIPASLTVSDCIQPLEYIEDVVLSSDRGRSNRWDFVLQIDSLRTHRLHFTISPK